MSIRETSQKLPPRWSDDLLSAFVGQAFANTLATFVQKPRQYGVLAEVDKNFQAIGTNLSNPGNFLAAMLLLRAHSAFRGAARMALSGQTVDTFPVLRASLEYALYAFHIYRKPELGEVWLRRHDSPEALRAVKRQFGYTVVAETLQHEDPRLAAIVEELYDRSIDFGAHPNERAMTGSMTVVESDDGKTFNSVYLHADGIELEHALKTTAQVGVAALSVFQPIWRERFQILGIDLALDELKSQL